MLFHVLYYCAVLRFIKDIQQTILRGNDLKVEKFSFRQMILNWSVAVLLLLSDTVLSFTITHMITTKKVLQRHFKHYSLLFDNIIL